MITQLPVPAGRYSLWLAVTDDAEHDLSPWQSVGHLEVEGAPLETAPTGVVRLSPVYVRTRWEL